MKDQKDQSKFVSNDEYNYRLDVCEGDSQYPPCEKYKKETGQCMACGCFVKAKANIKKSDCPLKKW